VDVATWSGKFPASRPTSPGVAHPRRGRPGGGTQARESVSGRAAAIRRWHGIAALIETLRLEPGSTGLGEPTMIACTPVKPLLAAVAILLSSVAAPAQCVVRDIMPPGSTDSSSGPSRYVDLGGIALFIAQDAFGVELWRSDGTAAGTARVLDVWPGRIRAGATAGRGVMGGVHRGSARARARALAHGRDPCEDVHAAGLRAR
jgi:ELWxxDGT repeat protein